MRAVEISAFGPPSVLQLGQRPLPAPGAGELLIRVSASGVNRPDVLQRTGNYPVPPGASDIPGLEVAGVIADGDSLALAQAGLAVGQRVCALVAGGGYAEYCVAPIGQCLPVPAGLSDIEAASLPETFFTVWSNVFDRARLQAGESILIQGGSSGIGVTAIQMAKAFGAQVFVTAGSTEKCQACLALGADHAINYRSHDFAQELMRLTDNGGVDIILDMVAGAYITKEVQCLREDGRLVMIAVQGGVKSEFNAGLVLRRRLTITGSTLRPRPIAFKTAIAQACRDRVWPLIEQGRIKPVIHSVFAAADAAQAHELMESNQHIGKIMLTWGAA
ncbi:MAG: NAD(P)H-quinone oxidoreductase [Betaproteobacteria bacterium]|nr:NAD(P)H-quinone oxidoreductase [Betaproteobacteria bacterium]